MAQKPNRQRPAQLGGSRVYILIYVFSDLAGKRIQGHLPLNYPENDDAMIQYAISSARALARQLRMTEHIGHFDCLKVIKVEREIDLSDHKDIKAILAP